VSVDSEQKARIALLEHYTSQLQGYKVNLLTIIIAFFAGVESFRIILPSTLFLSVLSGVCAALIFYCAAKIFLFGHHVVAIIRMESCYWQTTLGQPLGQLDEMIQKNYYDLKGRFVERCCWIEFCGCDQQILVACVLLGMFVGGVVFGLVCDVLHQCMIGLWLTCGHCMRG
jgi:hypothetical protein